MVTEALSTSSPKLQVHPPHLRSPRCALAHQILHHSSSPTYCTKILHHLHPQAPAVISANPTPPLLSRPTCAVHLQFMIISPPPPPPTKLVQTQSEKQLYAAAPCSAVEPRGGCLRGGHPSTCHEDWLVAVPTSPLPTAQHHKTASSRSIV